MEDTKELLHEFQGGGVVVVALGVRHRRAFCRVVMDDVILLGKGINGVTLT